MALQYKAIFFDRDETLTTFNPAKRLWLHDRIEEWSGKPYRLTYEEMMDLFAKAGRPATGIKTVEAEITFWKSYYPLLLEHLGVREKVEERGQILFEELWCNNDRILFEEVVEVMTYFKDRGFKIGIISDTFPSLQMTLEQLDLGQFIDSYTCADVVGASKPDPLIFNTALDSLGVTAEESLFVDDYDVEADGARDLGFTSFCIRRKGDGNRPWDIQSMREIVDYVEKKK